jgi:hypothetical protein
MAAEHHSTERLQVRWVQRGSGRLSFLAGQEKAGVNQTDIGTVSMATLRTLLKASFFSDQELIKKKKT